MSLARLGQLRLLVLVPLLATFLAGCSSQAVAGWTFTPTQAPAAQPSAASAAPSGGASAGTSASSSGQAGGETVKLSAQGIKFDQSSLTAAADKAFTIDFQNNDAGIPHNVVIYKGSSATGTPVFSGDTVTGPGSKQYSVPALSAGSYFYICAIHPTIMTGTLTVK